MKYLTILFSFLIFSMPALAKVDLRYCAQFAKKTGDPNNNLSGYVDGIGRGQSPNGRSKSFDKWTYQSGDRGDATLHWEQQGKQWVVKKIEIREDRKQVSNSTWGGSKVKYIPLRTVTTTFKVQNGRCIPHEVTLEDYDNPNGKVTLNSKVCNDIHNFFNNKKYKKAAKCLSPALSKNLEKFLNRNSRFTGYRKAKTPDSKSALELAYDVREACKRVPVIGKMTSDAALWKGAPKYNW